MEFKLRYFRIPGQSFFLFGPRGTGKSTWLKKNIERAAFIDLLDSETYRLFSARPERLREFVEAQEDETITVIDEIQKVPELLDIVHLLMEEGKDRRFVLTGSSARKLKRRGVDLLAGRALLKTMHPFMASEIKDEFILEKALDMGMIPLVLGAENPEETLRTYLSLYIREEVQIEGFVRNIGSFNRFLEAISFSHGSVLNIADIARDCQIERKTVEGYISILEDLLLAFRVPVFTKRAKRQIISHPKFFYFDAGVYRTVRPAGPLDIPQEIDGAALEGLVAQHLRAWNAYAEGNCKLYFWRTKSGNEVDFVVYGPNHFYAFEVKNTNRIQSKMLRGLTTFKEDYPEAEVCFLYRGRERMKIKGIICLPVNEFLISIHPEKDLV